MRGIRPSVAVIAWALAACVDGTGQNGVGPETVSTALTTTDEQIVSVEAASRGPDIHPQIWPEVKSPLARDEALEAEVARLLSGMSLEQKVGQIIQGDIASLTPEDVRAYHLGSVLNGGNSAPKGDLRGDPADWVALADAFWDASMSEDGIGVPVIWGTDAVHGHSNVVGATIFPHNIGLGAANDPDLIRRIGEITAKEIAVTGLDWTFAPTVAVPQDDRWGRTYEGYSESPEIVAAYAGEMVLGLQGKPGTEGFLGDGRVVSTVKHFVGDGGTEGGRDQGETVATEEELRDIHAAGYPPAIEAGVQSAMASFSGWRGRKMHGFGPLLTDVLVGRMGLDGFVVGDWNGHAQVEGCSPTDCLASLEAGVDMFMAPDSWRGLYDTTLEQARSGELSMDRLDEAVSRILRVKLRAKLVEKGRPSERPLAGDFALLGAPEHRAVAREAVRKSLVLLKNDGALPIAPGARVLVTGNAANDMGRQTGGWTLSWQGDGNAREDFPNADTIWEGLKAAIEATGGTAELSEDASFEEAPDVAVVVYGEMPYAEFRGDRPSVDYADREGLGALRRLQDAGIPTVSVFVSGRPLWVSPELNASDAFVAAWLPGSEGAGIADVLVAEADGQAAHDFSGRLSYSWPEKPDQARLNVGDEDYAPLFAYGYGLSYEAPGEVGEVGELEEGYESVGGDPSVLLSSGDAQAGRTLVLASSGRETVVADATARVGDGALALSRTDRDAQEDSVRLVWDGTAPASLIVRGEEVDLEREANADIGITVDYRYDDAPGAAVRLGVGGVEVDLPAREPGRFETFSARLTCFSEGGADLSAIEDLAVLTADRPATLTVSSIRWTPSEGGAPCPRTE